MDARMAKGGVKGGASLSAYSGSMERKQGPAHAEKGREARAGMDAQNEGGEGVKGGGKLGWRGRGRASALPRRHSVHAGRPQQRSGFATRGVGKGKRWAPTRRFKNSGVYN